MIRVGGALPGRMFFIRLCADAQYQQAADN